MYAGAAMIGSDVADRYLKPQDVAAILGKSTDWVRKRAADGTLPHRKIGRDLRFIRREIDAWVEQQAGTH